MFSAQALGLIVGPLIALALLGAGTSTDLTWRLLLVIGALPASAVPAPTRRRCPSCPGCAGREKIVKPFSWQDTQKASR